MTTDELVAIAFAAQAPKYTSGELIPFEIRPAWAVDELAHIALAVSRAVAEECAKVADEIGASRDADPYRCDDDPAMARWIAESIRDKFKP